MKPKVELVALTVPADTVSMDPALWDETISGLQHPLDIIEYSGRWDYGPKSLAKMGERDIIRRWLKQGHESMLEMVDVQFLITCSRVVSHELIRHRVASYQQESQRFVRYDEEEPEDLFYLPAEVEGGLGETIMLDAYYAALKAYKQLRLAGVSPQIARYVLPNATRTRINIKTNLREWRHILRLRMHTSAQPEMREVATLAHDVLVNLFPEVFDDIRPWLDAGERAAR